MNNKAHLTQEGLNLIRTIKSGMNSCRWKASTKSKGKGREK
jgi:hypothetical protein